MVGNKSDECYIFFDKVKPMITEVTNITADADLDGKCLDVKYKSKSTISKVFIIYDTGKVKEASLR